MKEKRERVRKSEKKGRTIPSKRKRERQKKGKRERGRERRIQ